MVSGVLDPLVAHSSNLLEQAGVEPGDALPALIALARSTLDRIEEGRSGSVDSPAAAYEDAETVALHLRALDPEDARTYATFAREGLRLLDTEQGGRTEAREAIERELERHLQSEPTEVGAGH